MDNEAYKLGQEFAKRVRVGKRFFGYMPIAKKLYKNSSVNYFAFIVGYSEILNSYEIRINPETGLISGFNFITK